jgi:hypothetical protein
MNDIVGEEVEMGDTDYATLKNEFIKPKKRVSGDTEPESSSDQELRAQFSTARYRKKTKESTNDEVKQGSNKNKNIIKSQIHNKVNERIEQGLIQQAESEGQSLGN